ncbi:MAG: P-type conjugative transfer protein TrbL [Halothiobacillus sp.]|nr:P-type conjugative transfer protein TrbL [Halothiobacillus sp.]
MKAWKHLAVAVPLLASSTAAHATLTNDGIFDTINNHFHQAASFWQSAIITASSWLFWTLVLISMVWTFGMMALRRADIQEFFAEFVRFTIFTGFYWWLLSIGPLFARDIIMGLSLLGAQAIQATPGGTALGGAYAGPVSPSGIADVGFSVFDQVVTHSSIWSPVTSAIGMLIGIIILVIVSLIALNMLLLFVSGWVLAYAGVFILGFGGARWTSDMAINYYKIVLGLGLQVMTMVMLVGVGSSILQNYYLLMSKDFSISEMAVLLVVAVILLGLVNKVPPMVAGIINGGSPGSISQAGAGSFIAASSTALAATQLAAAAAQNSASSIAGAGSALIAAFKSAQAAESGIDAGGDVMSSMARSLTSGGDCGSSGGSGDSPMDRAAGFDSSSPMSFSSFRSSGSGASASSGSGVGTAQGGGSGASKESGGGTVQGGGSSGSGGSTLAKAGRIAAGTGANLARGAGAMVGDKVARTVEAAKSHVAGTVGGRLAYEINNPGSLAQARQDERDIAAAESMKEQQRGEDARSFLAEQANPTFENNSLTGSGSEPVDFESEIAAFVNRNDKDGD